MKKPLATLRVPVNNFVSTGCASRRVCLTLPSSEVLDLLPVTLAAWEGRFKKPEALEQPRHAIRAVLPPNLRQDQISPFPMPRPKPGPRRQAIGRRAHAGPAAWPENAPGD